MTENKIFQKSCGRPSGRKKTAKIEITIEPEVKTEFMELLAYEGKNASAEIGQWIRAYIRDNRKKTN